jgi:hypothetical protein
MALRRRLSPVLPLSQAIRMVMQFSCLIIHNYVYLRQALSHRRLVSFCLHNYQEECTRHWHNSMVIYTPVNVWDTSYQFYSQFTRDWLRIV